MDSLRDSRFVLRARGPKKVNDDTKKAITVGAILCVIGAVLGLLLSGSIRGLLGAATGFLPTVSGLGAASRNNRRVAESIGTIREGLDDGTSRVERSIERVERSIEHLESAQRGIRASVETLRDAAKPVGAPVDLDLDRDSSHHSSVPD